MQNRFIFAFVVGLVVFVLVATGIYRTKTAREESSPEPIAVGEHKPAVVVEPDAGGSVVLPETITHFAAEGPDGLVSVQLQEGVGQLPVGEYRVGAWQAERRDDQGNTWTLTGHLYGTEEPFQIAKGGKTDVDVGEPIVAVVYGSRIGPKFYSFGQSLQGRLDEQITLTRNGSRPGAPKLRIKNKDGTYDRTFAFRYG